MTYPKWVNYCRSVFDVWTSGFFMLMCGTIAGPNTVVKGEIAYTFLFISKILCNFKDKAFYFEFTFKRYGSGMVVSNDCHDD